MRSKLLCTYAHCTDLNLVLDYIQIINCIREQSIRYYYTKEDDLVYCFYSWVPTSKMYSKNTLLIHRKTKTNTYYSINAMNSLIQECNNGILDINFKINWENYTNTLLLCNGDVIKKLSLIIE